MDPLDLWVIPPDFVEFWKGPEILRAWWGGRLTPRGLGKRFYPQAVSLWMVIGLLHSLENVPDFTD